MTEERVIKTIIEAMSDKKAENIISLDLRELEGTIANHFVICSASSTIQVGAIASHITKDLIDKCKEKPFRVQGQENSLWITLDFGNIIAHVFLDEMREFYKLEELWSDAKIVDHN